MPGTLLTKWVMTLTAWGTVRGISITTMPPPATASAANMASSAELTRTAAIMPVSSNQPRTSNLFTVVVSFGVRFSSLWRSLTELCPNLVFRTPTLWIAQECSRMLANGRACSAASKCRFPSLWVVLSPSAIIFHFFGHQGARPKPAPRIALLTADCGSPRLHATAPPPEAMTPAPADRQAGWPDSCARHPENPAG